MKILVCSHLPLDRSFGGAKVFVEVAEALKSTGCKVDLVGPEIYAPATTKMRGRNKRLRISIGLRDYLVEHAGKYDVVDYEHGYLPYRRSEFPPTPLFVARSVLLRQHLDQIAIPRSNTLFARFSNVLMGSINRRVLDKEISDAQYTVEQADLVNVPNYKDRQELIRRGIPDDKIIVIPFGMSMHRISEFAGHKNKPVSNIKVVFVGTFHPRKGALDLPLIVEVVTQELPAVCFEFIGTRQPGIEVVSSFPRNLRRHINILPTYDPNELPSILSDASIGIFPSYMEGFPFGVLEMLAAGLPVVSYMDTPGPSMMLPDDWLVPNGDSLMMSAKVVALLRDRVELSSAQERAKKIAHKFAWKNAALQTRAAYSSALIGRRAINDHK